MTKIKICGLTRPEEGEWLLEETVDFAGMVMYCPKSKRNITAEQAAGILEVLGDRVKKIAVVVSPDLSQIREIENLHFDYIQIHGELKPKVEDSLNIPYFRAFNVNNVQEIKDYCEKENCIGFVFDAPSPGSGKTFDWTTIPDRKQIEKLFVLAGGLEPGNVSEAIRQLHPDVVDVSSGVENVSGSGKDRAKIHEFVQAVRKFA